MLDKPLMTEEIVQRKEFTYTLNGVRLNFTLRNEVKVELQAFRNMMVQAIKDVDKELARISARP